MVEQLGLEIGARRAEDLYVFEHTHKPAPEPPACRHHDKHSEQRGPRPGGDSAGGAGGLERIGSASTRASWRRGTWRCIGRMRATDRSR
jgi:hypothetical protein